ncbi:MAG: hypothetical protein OXG55_10580, partial [bacterium]|nr:hypothetical protein [bacterium]
MGDVGVRGGRALVSWVVSAALLAGAVGGAVVVPTGAGAQVVAPAATGSVPDVELSVGGAARTVAAGDYFTGAVASYGASSADTAVVSVSASGSAVTVTPVGAGSTTVTVTAANTAGSAAQTFAAKVLPAGCVVELGTLAAGSVTTKTGAWARGDGCRSAHRAGGSSARYAARYYSFTVAEPLEAWFRLSSPHSRRLYLLAGAGTGGRVLDSAGTPRAASAALWEALQPGDYTLEATTYHPNREGDFSVSIDSMALSPPAACTTPLGALAAGPITTRSGSWARGDGCRSVHLPDSAAQRHYARYYTFTVTEALEARFALSAAQGKYLHLLAGAGAGGRVIARRGNPSAAAPATGWAELQPGAYTIAAATYRPSREGDFSLSIDSMALTPPAACVTSLGAVAAGATAARSGSWARGDGCRSLHATSSRAVRYYADYTSFTVPDAGEARIALTSGPQARLYLLGGAGAGGRLLASAGHTRAASNPSIRRVLQPGAYTIETAARSPRVQADYTLSVSFAVSAPTRGDAPAAQQIPARAAAAQIDMSAAFNGNIDTYTATSSDTSVVTTSVNGPVLTLNGVTAGTATVTVTATNAAGSAAQTFAVTVNAAAPQAAGALAAQTLTVGGTATVDVAAAFTGAVDAYSATSSDTAAVTVSTTGSVLTLTGVAEGRATVTVTATNTTGSATQTIAVTVAPAAPQAAGALAAQTLTAGASATVDAAGAFSGTVDAYTVTSSNGAVLDIALAGSVITLTGVAAGTATVTVTAANVTGSATQTMSATVNLPPAPTLGAPLAAQTLQATETLTIDIAAGFNGRIDTYTATSGDTNKLTAAADGPEITLTGVTAGTTTVTITAINAAGRAARSFNVTVSPLTAPRTASTPTARTIAVGAELPLEIADAFSGTVHTYSATSSDTTKLTTSVDGSTVTLVGVAAGTATVTLTAANTAGSATQTFTATIQTPDELTIALAAPSHCLGSEGVLAPGGGRRGVGHIDITYHVTGGAAPYTITSPDAPGTTHTEPTGTFTISCAQRGIDLSSVTVETNVVEAGPRTLTITATDNTAVTTSTDIQIEIAEDAYTTEYNDGQMHPGKTYVLGTPDDWVLITLPRGLTLQFTGLSQHNTAHFTEPTSGAEIVLDWTTGREIRRTTPTGIGHTNTRTRTANPLFSALKIAKPTGQEYGAEPDRWRPYQDLPDGTYVGVHLKMLAGEELVVCTLANDSALKQLIQRSTDAWNQRIQIANAGFSRDVFDFRSACPSSQNEIDVKVIQVTADSISNYCDGTPPACAETLRVGGNPPRVTGKTIYIDRRYGSGPTAAPPPNPEVPGAILAGDKLRVMIHELGHMLGLGDYGNCGSTTFVSVMAGGKCIPSEANDYGWSRAQDLIQDRDLEDLYALYHPRARVGMFFYDGDSAGWRLYAGRPPADKASPRNYVSNAERYVVFGREVESNDTWVYKGSFSRDWAWDWLANGEAEVRDEHGQVVRVQNLWIGDSLTNIRGREFAVFGITGGDIEQTSRREIEEHATWQANVRDTEWSLGEPLIVFGPPEKPRIRQAVAGNRYVTLSWNKVPGATKYYIHVYFEGGTQTIRKPIEVDAFKDAVQITCGITVTIDGLRNRTAYDFSVEAARLGVFMRSQMSDRVSATPTSPISPRSAGAGGRSDSSTPLAAGRSVGGSGSCTVPVEVDPIVEVSGVCPEDGHSWALRAVGAGFACERPDSAPVTPGERVASCPSLEPPYAVVPVDGVEKCTRSLGAAPTASLGDPECEDGFTPVSGGASCSKTDAVPASATRSCSAGYSPVRFFVGPGVAGYRCEKSVPATAETAPSCSEGYSLARIPLGGQYCRKSVPATATVTRSCSGDYVLARFFVQPGVAGYRCEKSVPATASTTYSCSEGYSLARIPLGGQYCRKSVAATATVTYVCSEGYSLARFFVQPGVAGYRCEKSVAAAAKTTYECRSGYRLVTTLLGGAITRYCRKTVPATATYSCPSGYTRSATTCHKYTYTSPTGATCPAGYTLIYNGLYYLCRKKLTTAATITYSCSSGRLSGSNCILTAAPKTTTTYSCSAGTL